MRSARRHSGFTLIEILISIGIVALLATMLVMAIAPSVEAAKVNATKAIIAQIDAQLQQRLTSFNLIKDSEWEDLAVKVRKTWPGGEGYAPLLPVANVLVKKNRYLAAFPQRLQDLYGVNGEYDQPPPSGPPTATAFQVDDPLIAIVKEKYGKHPKRMPPNPPLPDLVMPSIDGSVVPMAGPEYRVSSSELLYQLLSHGRAIKTESYSIDGIPSRYITDLDEDGLPEIRDAWGNELRFYAAPTALVRVDRVGKNPADLTRGARLLYGKVVGDDGTARPPEFPEDVPAGQKFKPSQLYADPFDRLNIASKVAGINQYYDANTYFSYLVVSAGPDGELGLFEPDAIGADRLARPSAVSVDELSDNITNRQ